MQTTDTQSLETLEHLFRVLNTDFEKTMTNNNNDFMPLLSLLYRTTISCETQRNQSCILQTSSHVLHQITFSK